MHNLKLQCMCMYIYNLRSKYIIYKVIILNLNFKNGLPITENGNSECDTANTDH